MFVTDLHGSLMGLSEDDMIAKKRTNGDFILNCRIDDSSKRGDELVLELFTVILSDPNFLFS